MKITWYGHSAFAIETGQNRILIDPFFDGNPAWEGGWKEAAEGCTHVLLTHGHDDHLGNALDICKHTDALLVANFEICMYLVGRAFRTNGSTRAIPVDLSGAAVLQQPLLTRFIHRPRNRQTAKTSISVAQQA